MDTLYIAVPCYNEAEVLPESSRRLYEKLDFLISSKKISPESKIVFINDGSRDGTWDIIERLAAENSRFAGISLSRNRGHQNALLAGLTLLRNSADMIISIDADLQDDINAIDKMADAYRSGCDIVYGVRSRRRTDSFFERFTAEGYYKLLAALGCDIVFNHADYRLMSARALDALSEYGERDMFLRGIVPMLGFKTAVVEYERSERLAGESKYTLRKMIKLASDGALSLSLRPVRLIAVLGFTMLVAGIAAFIHALITSGGGWQYAVGSVWSCAGLIVIALGVVGEYAGRTYIELKNRPRYHIDKTAGLDLE